MPSAELALPCPGLALALGLAWHGMARIPLRKAAKTIKALSGGLGVGPPMIPVMDPFRGGWRTLQILTTHGGIRVKLTLGLGSDF